MKINLKELREKAEKATPGPWIGHTSVHEIDDWKYTLQFEDKDIPNLPEDVDFIAAANPATILKLLDALETAIWTLEFYKHTQPIDEIIKQFQDCQLITGVKQEYVERARIALAKIEELVE